MSDTKIYGMESSHAEKCSDCINGVGCGVVGCKFHTTDGNCCADHIVVQNGTATRKAETFCSTFEPGHTCE